MDTLTIKFSLRWFSRSGSTFMPEMPVVDRLIGLGLLVENDRDAVDLRDRYALTPDGRKWL